MPITMIQRCPGMPSQAHDQTIATVGKRGANRLDSSPTSRR